MSPIGLTFQGRKDQYDRLDVYTDEYRQQGLALAQRQLQQLRAQFNPASLSPAGRLSYRMFEEEIEQDIESFQWRWHSFPASTNGSPAGSIPVFLINQHRVSSVADAEAYIARLREVERVMNEITANMRRQVAAGIVPSSFNFAPVKADAKRVIAGAPFTAGADVPLFADFKAKVGKLDVPAAEKARLVGEARDALAGPVRRGYQAFLATWDALEAQAAGNRGAWSLPEGEAYYANRLKTSTTTDLTADGHLDADPQRIQQVRQTVVVDLLHQCQQTAQFPLGETLPGEPVQVLTGQVGKDSTLVFTEGHLARYQQFELFRIHGNCLVQDHRQNTGILHAGQMTDHANNADTDFFRVNN